ncbi:hypothetical protein [Celeribacter sp.]|uniref:hypothetical protein n=1 Tax=Celeribacter sp. TaxID=1890673 RepID=UPI003A9464D1
MQKQTRKLEVALYIFAALVLFAYVMNFIYALKSNASGGTFGDTFGAANAFFSGGALLMLIYAIILQRNELNLVKQERDDTRKILSGQEDLNAQQKAALDRQAFEQSFFSLLSLISEERQQVSNRIGTEGTATFLGIAATNAFRRIREGKDPESVMKANYLHKLASLANLLFAGYEFLETQREIGHANPMHIQSLRSFVDLNTSKILIPYAIKNYKNPSPMLLALGCIDYFTNDDLIAIKALAPDKFSDIETIPRA